MSFFLVLFGVAFLHSLDRWLALVRGTPGGACAAAEAVVMRGARLAVQAAVKVLQAEVLRSETRVISWPVQLRRPALNSVIIKRG